MFLKHMSIIVILSCCWGQIKCARMLMVTLAGTKSHIIPFLELGKGLAARGHNLTVVSAFPSGERNSTVREINPNNLVLYVQNFTNWDLLGPKLRGEAPLSIMDMVRYGYEVCEAFLSDIETKMLLLRNTYDLLILDGAYPECALGLVHRFRTPFIYVNTVAFYTGSISQAGNPTPYSITPFLGLPYTDNMMLHQRLINSLYHMGLVFVHSVGIRWFVHKVLRRHIDPNIPSPMELSKNVSLILQNGHFSVTYPRPYLPSVVEVACLHCHPAKPLAEDLESFVSGGQGNGFVYVSMGSSVKASNMPEELRTLLVHVFRLLPYQVLWKWETHNHTCSMQDLPSNVMLSAWFPQQDLLGHHKIKAFVTHGGLLSLFETVYHGVPVVAMPVFCDHDSNVEKSVSDGYAIRLELRDLTSTRLLRSLINVINDPKYKVNALRRSILLRDQLEPPLVRAIYWTEYVLRHGGGYHLQSPSKDMTFIRYYLIDVIFIAILILYLAWFILYYVLKLIARFVSHKHATKAKIN